MVKLNSHTLQRRDWLFTDAAPAQATGGGSSDCFPVCASEQRLH